MIINYSAERNLPLAASRQSQHPLGQDVAQDLGGSSLDRVGPRAQELIAPAVAVANLARRSREVDGRLGHALVQLRPHQLEDRALRARNAVALHGGDRPVAIELEGARL